MKALKRLQDKYKAGKITREEYEEQLQELLDDEMIDQAQHDEAIKLEAEGDDDLKYTQADVDKIVKKKAESLIKRAYRDAGIEIPKGDLVDGLTENLKAGEAAGKNDSELATENARLKGELAKAGSTGGELARLQRENAILKVAGEFKPHNAARVVTALDDYEDLLDYDDEGKLDVKSVRGVLRKIQKAEPYLFNTADADGGDGGDDQGAGEDSNKGIKGKGPGGGGGGKSNDKVDKGLAAARELMGWKSDDAKK